MANLLLTRTTEQEVYINGPESWLLVHNTHPYPVRVRCSCGDRFCGEHPVIIWDGWYDEPVPLVMRQPVDRRGAF